MKLILLLVAAVLVPPRLWRCRPPRSKVSEATQACIECHRVIHPGIVADWQRSRHAAVTPKEALGVQGLGRKVSSPAVPEALRAPQSAAPSATRCGPGSTPTPSSTTGHDIHIVVSPGRLPHLPCRGGRPVLPQHHGARLQEPGRQQALQRPRALDPGRHPAAGRRGRIIRPPPATHAPKPATTATGPGSRSPAPRPATPSWPASSQFPKIDGLAEPGRRAGQPRRHHGLLRGLPHAAPVFDRNGAQALHLQGVPRRAGRPRLQGLRGQQARQPVLDPQQGLGLDGRAVDHRARISRPRPAPPATSAWW